MWLHQFDTRIVNSGGANIDRLDTTEDYFDQHAEIIDAVSVRDIRFEHVVDPETFLTSPEIDGILCRYDAVPYDDLSYRRLSTTLIPHPSIPNMFLLEFVTFAGALAFQPCSKDIDLRGFFKALDPVYGKGDPLFKAARIDEDTLWDMRSWLMYWYNVADNLLFRYGFIPSAPNPDWFERPLNRSVKRIGARGNMGVVDRRQIHTQASSSDTGTIIHHSLDDEGDDEGVSTPASLDMIERLEQDFGLLETSNGQPLLFDPTPGGRVSPRRQRSQQSTDRSPPVSESALDPSAPAFIPSLPNSEELKDDHDDNSEDLFESCSNISTMSDWSTRSTSSESNILDGFR
ncbi:hypothetical protein FZEAL_9838 [Fusarium zealandicum]|uniref:Uncharacterized protein n=1 Tax=Fusarium zealandicum TaxID=1053134 RepID=A0A8H4XEK0_9HYPO|nr:hypothetical protein FZEAL_9838 [Fusarium zealandicum]